jgi:hypothetical protein
MRCADTAPRKTSNQGTASPVVRPGPATSCRGDTEALGFVALGERARQELQATGETVAYHLRRIFHSSGSRREGCSGTPSQSTVAYRSRDSFGVGALRGGGRPRRYACTRGVELIAAPQSETEWGGAVSVSVATSRRVEPFLFVRPGYKLLTKCLFAGLLLLRQRAATGPRREGRSIHAASCGFRASLPHG